MKSRHLLTALCGAALLSLCATAQAVADPANDFLPGYTGSHAGDLDVLSSTVTYNTGSHLFDFTATLAAPVGTTATAFYVWGIDRGQGTERFNTGANPIGAGVKFDSVVIFRLDGSATVNRIVGGGATVLPGDVTWSGDTISGSIPAALLPSLGLAPEDYTWNLWPRDGAVAGNAAISDFAPDASNGEVTSVPEPQSWLLLGGGLALLAAAARQRKQA
ncbi:MAG: PEP-CTERM sorting domain-containing protein [Betaproteobacteria bacterium]